MRISYAIILAAIAVFEGCKPKDADTGKKDNENAQGELEQEDEDEEEEEEEETNGNNLGKEDPNKLKPSGKTGTKEAYEKANAVVKKHQEKLTELQAAQVKLSTDVAKAESEFNAAKSALDAAVAAPAQLDEAKSALVDAVVTPTECPITRLAATESIAPISQQILNAVGAVPADDIGQPERNALLEAANDVFDEIGDNRPTDAERWNDETMQQPLTNLIEAVRAEIAAPERATQAKTDLLAAIITIALPKTVRDAASTLRATIHTHAVDLAGDQVRGDTQALIGQIATSLEASPPAAHSVAATVVDLKRTLVEKISLLRTEEQLRNELLELIPENNIADDAVVGSNIQDPLRQLGRDLRDAAEAARADRQRLLLEGIQALGAADADTPLHRVQTAAAKLADPAAYNLQVRGEINQARVDLIDSILPGGNPRVPRAILDVADVATTTSAQLAIAVTGHRSAHAAEFAEHGALQSLAGSHDSLTRALQTIAESPQRIGDLKTACLAAIRTLVPAQPADPDHERLTRSIAAYREAVAAPAGNNVQTTKGQLLEAITAIPEPRRTPIATVFTRFIQARDAAGRATPTEVATLQTQKAAKEKTFNDLTAQVAPLKDQITKEQAALSEANKALEKLKKPTTV